jgi:hypothetical protein
MGIAELATRRFDVIPALIVGLIVYFAVLVLTGAIGRREAEIARMLLGRSGPAVSPP